jgi:hypothetical protein
MAQPLKPFTAEHALRVREGLSNIAEAQSMMDRGKKCGLDCAADEHLADMLKQALEGYRDHWTEPQPGS